MTTISSVVLSMGCSPLIVKTAERRQEFPGILNVKGGSTLLPPLRRPEPKLGCRIVLRLPRRFLSTGIAGSCQSAVTAGDAWQGRDLWQPFRLFQSSLPLLARGVFEYWRIKVILGHFKSAVVWALKNPLARPVFAGGNALALQNWAVNHWCLGPTDQIAGPLLFYAEHRAACQRPYGAGCS